MHGNIYDTTYLGSQLMNVDGNVKFVTYTLWLKKNFYGMYP